MVRIIKQFRGSTAQEFVLELEEKVQQGIALLLERPRWPDDPPVYGDVHH